MSNKTVFGSIAHRNDTAENWARAIRFIPKQGEIIIYNPDDKIYSIEVDVEGKKYTVESSSRVRFKIGDGNTNVNALPFVATFEGDEEIFAKLDGIEERANNYTHPTYRDADILSDLYKITVDKEGHVSAVSAVKKTDITNLGIPGQDTVYTHPRHNAYDSGIYEIEVDGEGHVSAATPITKAELALLIGNASDKEAGLLSAADKYKLDDIEAGAEVNDIKEVQVNGTPVKPSSSKVVNIPVPDGALASKTYVAVDDLDSALQQLLCLGKKEGEVTFTNNLATNVTSNTQTLTTLQTSVDNNTTAIAGKLDATKLDCEVAVRFDDGNWITFKAMQIENPDDLPTETTSTTTDI